MVSNGETGKTYTIILDRNETLFQGLNLFYGGREITIILRGRGAVQRISIGSSSILVRHGVTLILENNITIERERDREGWLGGDFVVVGEGGNLIMNDIAIPILNRLI